MKQYQKIYRLDQIMNYIIKLNSYTELEYLLSSKI